MSSVTKNWTEADFRRELKKLDERVKRTQGIELVGAQLDIEFFKKATRTLGRYHSAEKKFMFSLAFFNSDVPEICALDVIAHEYAHYYDDVVFAHIGHTGTFKRACNIVGAKPQTYYSKTFEQASRKSEQLRAMTYTSEVKTGQKIRHPAYGEGTVKAVENKKISALLTVDFGDGGVRVLDEQWLRKHALLK